MAVIVTSEESCNYRQIITTANQTVFSDLSRENSGEGTAPDPHDLLLSAWGACTNMTLQLYARRKGWPLEKVATTLHEAREGNQTVIRKEIKLWGELDAKQVERLTAIAERCPINQMILGGKGSVKHVERIVALVTDETQIPATQPAS